MPWATVTISRLRRFEAHWPSALNGLIAGLHDAQEKAWRLVLNLNMAIPQDINRKKGKEEKGEGGGG